MKPNVMAQLILKDWRLQSRLIMLLTLGGAAALAFLPIGGKAIVVGTVFFFVAMIFCACLLPIQNIVNEQKKQTLPFIMSLPVSSARYGAAKLISTTAMFLISWLALLGAALFMILVRHTVPNGALPMGMVLMGFPLIGFCLVTGAALVGESEAWATSALAITNSSYWLVWFLLVSRVPSLMQNASGPVAVWSPAVFKILGTEFAIVLVILTLTLFLQSRKRSFI